VIPQGFPNSPRVHESRLLDGLGSFTERLNRSRASRPDNVFLEVRKQQNLFWESGNLTPALARSMDKFGFGSREIGFNV
jgi:hypothetical protein